MKRKLDDLKQTIFQIQNEFNSQIESLDQQIKKLNQIFNRIFYNWKEIT